MKITDLDGIVIVTGTDTDAGKTVTTAVIASALKQAGKDVLIVKPYQTGLTPEEPGDVHDAGRLAGIDSENLLEYARCPEPLAPTTSAARAGMTIPSIEEVSARVLVDSDGYDVTLVEGAGGVLVGLDNDGAGVLDLMDSLARRGHEPHVVVATRSVLGTLNHTGLTCNAIRDRGHQVDAIIIGSWPAEPDLAERCNLEEIEDAAGAPLAGVIPAGIGKDPGAVQRTARMFCQDSVSAILAPEADAAVVVRRPPESRGTIRYESRAGAVTPSQVSGFFVGWPKPPSPEKLVEVMDSSFRRVWALDGDRAVGYINAISDGVLTAFLPWLEVLPAYQGQGIGSELVRRIAEQLDGMYSIDLACDDNLVGYYKKLGFLHLDAMGLRRPENVIAE